VLACQPPSPRPARASAAGWLVPALSTTNPVQVNFTTSTTTPAGGNAPGASSTSTRAAGTDREGSRQ
jgi:hypothetical protein